MITGSIESAVTHILKSAMCDEDKLRYLRKLWVNESRDMVEMEKAYLTGVLLEQRSIVDTLKRLKEI